MNLVYTAIYGGYDRLIQPKFITEGWDYICYSDIEFDGGVWGVRKWDLGLDPVRSSKWIKIKHPMLNYDNILWVDGSIEITGNLNNFLSKLPNGDLVIPKHPDRRTLNGELDACIKMHKDDNDIMIGQVAGYGDFPEYVFTQNTVILRRANLDTAMDIWVSEVLNRSKRDQLSFGWAMWKANQKYSTFGWDIVEKYFIWHKHHDK